MCRFSAESTLNTLKTHFLHIFKELAAICLHIQNLHHMTAVSNQYIYSPEDVSGAQFHRPRMCITPQRLELQL